MDDADRQEIAGIVTAALDARMGPVPTPAPTVVGIVPFADGDTEASAQRVCTYIRNNPGVNAAGIVRALGLPTHWFRNPKMLANGERITPGLLVMRERAGHVMGDVPTATPRKATPAKPKKDPAQEHALMAVALRVSDQLGAALTDGLASGLLYEKAKSTTTLRNMIATVRTRGGVPDQ